MAAMRAFLYLWRTKAVFSAKRFAEQFEGTLL
jgi:hypothetical protein